MLISAEGRKVQPAIAQLEERRFVIGNRSLTTLGPVFESRWLDIFDDVTHYFAHSRAPSPAGVSAILGSSRLAESMKPYDCTPRPF